MTRKIRIVIVVVTDPGTDKTRTLVSRIVYLTQECGVSPSQITAVTFTNRAANEIRTRLIRYFGCQGLSSLFHLSFVFVVATLPG